MKYSSSYYVQFVSDLFLTNVMSSVESSNLVPKIDVVNTGLPMCVPADARIVLQGLLKMFFVKLELCRALLIEFFAEFAEFFS